VSITRSIKVHCDAPDCPRWVDGDVGQKPSTAQSRLIALRRGWRTRRMAGRFWDLCPQHTHWRPSRTVTIEEEL
jgi:hypothetical protein